MPLFSISELEVTANDCALALLPLVKLAVAPLFTINLSSLFSKKILSARFTLPEISVAPFVNFIPTRSKGSSSPSIVILWFKKFSVTLVRASAHLVNTAPATALLIIDSWAGTGVSAPKFCIG